jgi:peroxiredoxin Q/BCP
MAQLRQDLEKFASKDVVILVIGPENAKKFASYFAKHQLPMIGLPDPKHRVLKLYGQEIKLFKFGRMPAQVLVDKNGIARYVHYGNSMSDIPSNEELLGLVESIQNSQHAKTSEEVEHQL